MNSQVPVILIGIATIFAGVDNLTQQDQIDKLNGEVHSLQAKMRTVQATSRTEGHFKGNGTNQRVAIRVPSVGGLH